MLVRFEFVDKVKRRKENAIFSFSSLYLCIFASVRVTQTSKAMQTTAIGTVAYSLPQDEVILLTLLISSRYVLFAELRNIFEKGLSRNLVGINL